MAKIPFWGNVAKIPGQSHGIYRPQVAQKANEQTTCVVGNSFRDAVALPLQTDDPKLASRMYRAPAWGPFRTGCAEWKYGMLQGKPAVKRHRSFGDPVSFFDASCEQEASGQRGPQLLGAACLPRPGRRQCERGLRGAVKRMSLRENSSRPRMDTLPP
jgi:hypothetical protein